MLIVKLATGLTKTVIVDVKVLGVPFDTVNVTVYVPGLGYIEPTVLEGEDDMFVFPKFQL